MTEAKGPLGPPEAEPAPRASRRRHSAGVRRRRRVLTGVAGVLLVLALAAVTWYEVTAHALGPAGRAEIVQIQPGESVSAVATTLSVKRVIGSTLAFRLYDLVHGDPSITEGDYLFHQNLTFAEVHALLGAGPNISTVTVDAGLTLHEVAERVGYLPGHDTDAFAAVAAGGAVRSVFEPTGTDNLEGLVGSGTYLVLPGETDTALLTDMVHRFEAQATAAGVSTTSASALGLTPYQVIIAASVVEKEGYYPKNMPDVARVIYNRLGNDMPLDMDSTVLYSLGQDGGTATPQDEQTPSPYNTYLNRGLPPTPICTPSPDALAAAAHPPPGAWLYFVLVNKNGTMAFSDTYSEQLANEQLARSRGVG